MCIINARHAGKPINEVFLLFIDPFVVRYHRRKILAYNVVVVGRHPRLHHLTGHDVYRWSLCIPVLNGIWLGRWLRDFSVG